jgi:RND family efflux transporter MFP subunit
MRSELAGRLLTAVIVLGLPFGCWPAAAQGRGPAAVRYTEVVNHEVRGTIRLPGTVESRTESVVASEVAALVVAVDVEEGDRVGRGQSLVRLRTVSYDLQLQSAAGELKEGRARLELAQSKLRRARELFEDDVISEDQLDDAFSEFTAWQGRVDATEARIAELNDQIDRCTVRAPFSGVVVRKLTDVGQWMDAGGEVAEMVALNRIDVRVEVPERYYRQLDTSLGATVTFEALPGLRLDGDLTHVIPRADVQARTFPIKVRIANDDGRVGVGMLAQVALPLGETYDGVLVPKDALVRQGPQELVYRINEDQTVEPVPVTSGLGIGEWVAVQGPLAAGERVVTRGNERLFPGAPVAGEPLEYALP